MPIRNKVGRLRWLDVTVGMFQLEGCLASLITAFDITERRIAEEELRRVNQTEDALVKLHA